MTQDIRFIERCREHINRLKRDYCENVLKGQEMDAQLALLDIYATETTMLQHGDLSITLTI